MNRLKFGELRKYSVDSLLKEKPKKLKYLEFICNEKPDNYSIEINGVNVFCRDYNINYGDGWVIISFVNKNGDLICNISAFGSNENKEDECFLVGYGEIMSQTSLRRMNGKNAQIIEY